MQRVFDILLSGIAILCFLPILLALMLVLRFSGESEVFYCQIRVGRNGRLFGLLKFATMLKNSSNMGAGEITLRNDPRILPVGHFLRKTKLNELPQLLNVFVGDMSLVGPRPMVPNTFANYPADTKDIIGSVRPGLSGIGSIAFRDEERYLDRLVDPQAFYRSEIIPYKAELECWFVNNQSLLLYFQVIFVTAWVVLFPKSQIANMIFKDLPRAPESCYLNNARKPFGNP